MRTSAIYKQGVVAGLSFALCACGGGGTGTNFIPTPPQKPVPMEPVPPTPPPLPSGPIGLTGGPFATFDVHREGGAMMTASDAVHISYSPDTNLYTFSAPGLNEGNLVDPQPGNTSYDPDTNTWITIGSTVSQITDGNTTAQQPGNVVLQWMQAPYSASTLTYTSFGSWSGAPGFNGAFVYGTPTLAGDVPITGTASYAGSISGEVSEAGDFGLYGGIGLQFDFGAGTLSGQMQPFTTDGWNEFDLGTYTFRDTIFSTGSTHFSGAFTVPGSSDASSFEGRFTGPGAAELMGNFKAPYLSPTSQVWGTITGVFAGGKQP